MRGVYVIIVVVVLLGLGGVYLVSRNNVSPSEITEVSHGIEKEVSEKVVATAVPEVMEEKSEEKEEAVEITANAYEFYYEMSSESVEAGETVRLTLNNMGKGRHNWMIEGMEGEVQTKLLSSGESEMIEFVIDEPGEYTYYCSVPGHRQQGMVGTLVVE